MGWKQSSGPGPLNCETWHSLQIDSVRIELNLRTPRWCHKNCMVWGTPPSHTHTHTHTFGDQKCQKSSVLCEQWRRHTRKTHTVGKNEEGKKPEFFLYIRWYAQVLGTGHGKCLLGSYHSTHYRQGIGAGSRDCKGSPETYSTSQDLSSGEPEGTDRISIYEFKKTRPGSVTN